MNLIRRNQRDWDPFGILEDLQTDLNRAFDRSLIRKGSWEAGFRPDLELTEEDDKFLLHADIPGLKKEDISITVSGNQLLLRGERRKKAEEKKKGYFFSERTYGAFSRVIELPTDVQADKVKAAYQEGVLEVTLPKVESAKPKQVEVQVK